ncbi:MAG: NADH-quinone oxidoreductase subunit C [Candidatus Aminicenantes bacterium]|nr:NADH-quinone oxidoreductase subunit C [Candidatus Aminicenantes bacterium]
MEETRVLNELRTRFPGAVRDALSLAGDDVLLVEREGFFRLAEALKAAPLDYALLLDLTCVDYLARSGCLEMVYTFLSLGRNHRLRVKITLPAGEARLPSLAPLWKNADWLEREVHEMFGVDFEGHPGLRPLLLYEGFEGHPLRKDYPLRRRQPLIPLREEP